MLTKEKLLDINWKKVKGLLPAIIQNNLSGEVLMHGYMNEVALNKTIKEKIVTFFSRTKNKLWTKGETSGNFLKVIDIFLDCDHDTILIIVIPIGNTCHLSKNSCFDLNINNINFIFYFEKLLENRKTKYSKQSYTSNLYLQGIKRISQKVGEEATEVILAAMENNEKELINETSDLFYHLLVLLHSKNLNLKKIICNLKKRSDLHKLINC